VPGRQQLPLGAGDRHVEQSAFLGQPALLQRLLVRLERVGDLLAVAVHR